MSQTIDFHSITLGDRGRKTYAGIERLADGIKDVGLIQPLVLTPLSLADFDLDSSCETFDLPHYLLIAGGRRYHALKHLIETEGLPPVLYHATTCDKERPGYIFKGELSPIQRLLAELSENQDRHDLPWQEELALIVKAYWVSYHAKAADGEVCLMRNMGHMLGVGYHKLQAALAVHDAVKTSPERFASCTGIRAAYTQLLQEQSNFVAKLANETKGGEPSATTGPTITVSGTDNGPDAVQPSVRPTFNLASRFLHKDGINFLHECVKAGRTFDHIITDPDYAVAVEQLEANSDNQGKGVAQTSIEDSLSDLEAFIEVSFKVVAPSGFLVFFYDLDHHEKLQGWASAAGWNVQRWPVIWHKVDYRSNAAPSHNFCKNIEYAMVCRKPGAVLQKVQMSSVIAVSAGTTAKQFGHPFAKPEALWHALYGAVAIRGQSVLDPFMGSGSGSCSALTFGLEPVGCELTEDHHANALVNLKRTYSKLHPDCIFA